MLVPRPLYLFLNVFLRGRGILRIYQWMGESGSIRGINKWPQIMWHIFLTAPPLSVWKHTYKIWTPFHGILSAYGDRTPPPPPPHMTWNVSQNLGMGLEIMWCAYFQILKRGVATLACHAHFIQSENWQINFASEWLKFPLFVSR